MKGHDQTELLLDDIYNSPDPEIKRYMMTVMSEEMGEAQERALIRVAQRFKHLLSPQMQQVLAAQYPVAAQAACA